MKTLKPISIFIYTYFIWIITALIEMQHQSMEEYPNQGESTKLYEYVPELSHSSLGMIYYKPPALHLKTNITITYPSIKPYITMCPVYIIRYIVMWPHLLVAEVYDLPYETTTSFIVPVLFCASQQWCVATRTKGSPLLLQNMMVK